MQELTSQVFGQKLSANAKGCFTAVLSAEEEMAAVQMMLSSDEQNVSHWLDFLLDYSRTYLLSNQSIDVLIDNINNTAAKDLLAFIFNRFGYNDEQAIKVCKLALNGGGSYNVQQVLLVICDSGRVLSEDVAMILSRIDAMLTNKGKAEFAVLEKSYRQSVETYRKSDV